MKFYADDALAEYETSPSPRRAWIEMLILVKINKVDLMSPSPRRAWIEIVGNVDGINCGVPSPSPRRAWIEMPTSLYSTLTFDSRPPHGGRGLK